MEKGQDKEPNSRIDALREKIYSPKVASKKEHRSILHEQEFGVPRDWQVEETNEEEYVFPKLSFAKKLFLASLLVFLGTGFFAYYQFSTKSNVVSAENIDILITGPSFVSGGEPFPINIAVGNRNPGTVELGELIVSYPKGESVGGNESLTRLKRSIGDVPSGVIKREEVLSTIFGAEGSERVFDVTLEFRVPGSNAIFTKNAQYSVTIKSSPVTLSLDTLKETSSGQTLSFTVRARAERGGTGEPFSVYIEYPTGFQFSVGDPKPTVGNNTWDLGTLQKGEEKIISVRGTMRGEDGDERTFRVSGGSRSGRERLSVVYTDALATVVIKKPFVSVETYINNVKTEEAAVEAGGQVFVDLAWGNNLSRPINNLEISASLEGVLLDKTSVNASRGFYNSKEGVIVWNKSTDSVFSEISPGARGRVGFTFRSLPLFKIGEGVFRDPHITVRVSSKGNRFSDAGVPEQIASQSESVIKFNSDVDVISSNYHFDGAFVNQGPIPPEVEQFTTYTANFSVTNSSNRLSDAELKTKLPAYVSWVGKISPASEDVKYSSLDNEIIWRPGTIEPGAGFVGSPRSVSFQVGFTPSVSQVGAEVSLTEPIVFSARDTYTNKIRTVSKSALTTKTKDARARSGDELVSGGK